ncbi:hypothetical protein M9H77_16031 [Catharanthus roseus]|uniref:Uncharacterized protein n=1 Tax=Catharanthus roseus TaxID=4058 RepID=A0ACC0AYT9_CATRO|nr:hypothetical protein M9H77_16031 [Catharanthus roseus]
MKDICEDGELSSITWDDVTCNIDMLKDIGTIYSGHANAEEIRKSGILVYNMFTVIFWDSEAKRMYARSLDKVPLTDEKEEMLNNKELFDSFKPFYDMDFVDEETDCENEVQLPTAMETESSKGKMPAELSKSKEFTRKIMKKAFSIGKKSGKTFSDSKIKTMESQSTTWGSVTEVWRAIKEKAETNDKGGYLRYSIRECVRLFREDCKGMSKKSLLKAGDYFKLPENREVWIEYGKEGRWTWPRRQP